MGMKKSILQKQLSLGETYDTVAVEQAIDGTAARLKKVLHNALKSIFSFPVLIPTFAIVVDSNQP